MRVDTEWLALTAVSIGFIQTLLGPDHALPFGAVTIATVLAIVYLATRGLERLPLESAERCPHALAGAALGLCGLGIVYL
jgi:hypothetical protein